MAASRNDNEEQEEEDVAELTFPKEFENAETLLTSQVHMLPHSRKSQNKNSEHELDISNNFLKTLAYTERFSLCMSLCMSLSHFVSVFPFFSTFIDIDVTLAKFAFLL
ncbi:hypothetical protein HELRODRAFT_173679 [Helobdella robusta]|uniref:Uncharacterized protein n=1 Tax=Helobdella robusta TaxID=6412 RepID=T1F740_HELRO|nr:hypothetical protein HELRODRAFT_173679 [Helobdella robusta]ESO03386.1 hypothetical protein HELRODRAFT_173679 [Helobdella robusta]